MCNFLKNTEHLRYFPYSRPPSFSFRKDLFHNCKEKG